jgi:hypothetical protein
MSQRLDAVIESNTVTVTIPADICDQVRTQWSAFQIVKIHDELEIPLVVGSFQRFDGEMRH